MSDNLSESDLSCRIKDPDPLRRREAVEDLGSRRNPYSVGLLVESLGDPNRGVQQAAVDALIDIGGEQTVSSLVPKIDNDSEVIRNLALEVLQRVGNHATNVLIPYLKHESRDLRKAVAEVLGDTNDPSAVPPLLEAVDDADANVRAATIGSLGKLRDPRAVPVLAGSLKDKETWVRFAAAEALGNICDDETVKLLIDKLLHTDELTAFSIVEALGELKSRDAAQPLADLLPKVSGHLRNAIIKSLEKISEEHGFEILEGLDREMLYSYLIISLEDEDPDVRDASLKVLGKVPAKRAVMPLLECSLSIDIADEERLGWIRKAMANTGAVKKLLSVVENHQTALSLTVQALGDIKDESAVSALISLFGSASFLVRRSIVQALGNFKAEHSRELLLDALDDEDGKVRREVVVSINKLNFPQAVGSLFSRLDRERYKDIRELIRDSLVRFYRDGVKREEILNGFKQRFSEKAVDLRELCVRAIGNIDSPERLEFLEQALFDEEWRVRSAAVNCLGELEKEPRIFSLLKKAIKDDNENVRSSAVKMISRFDGEEVNHILIACLGEKDVWVKFQAAEILGERKEKRAVSPLLSVLEGDDGPHKIAALKALGTIGDPSALGHVRSLASHADMDIRQAALEALSRLNQADK